MDHQSLESKEVDDGYESRTSFDSPCHDKPSVPGDVFSHDSFIEPLFVIDSFRDSDCLISQKWEFMHHDMPGLMDDVFLSSNSNCLTHDRNMMNAMMSQTEVSSEDKFDSDDSFLSLLDDRPDDALFDTDSTSLEQCENLPGFASSLRNISLQIRGGIIASRVNQSINDFPSFSRSTDIGNLGALSYPVRSSCVNGTFSNNIMNNLCSSISFLAKKNFHSKKIYECDVLNSVLLDHDYCHFGKKCSGDVNNLRDVSQNGNGNRSSVDCLMTSAVALTKNRHTKTKRLVKAVKLPKAEAKTKVSLPKTPEFDNYVTLPGRHQDDYVYFAVKQPRRSGRTIRNRKS